MEKSPFLNDRVGNEIQVLTNDMGKQLLLLVGGSTLAYRILAHLWNRIYPGSAPPYLR